MKRYLLLTVGLLSLVVVQRASSQSPRIVERPQTPARERTDQITVEIQVVSVPDATWEKVAGAKNDTPLNYWIGLSLVERKQLLEAMTTLEHPTLTVPSGQTACIESTEQMVFAASIAEQKIGEERVEIGFKASVRAATSADRRFVFVDIDAKLTQFSPPRIATQRVVEMLKTPDGGTSVIVAGKTGRGEKDSRTILFLVTPRIVIDEEIEREILGSLEPAPRPSTRANASADRNRHVGSEESEPAVRTCCAAKPDAVGKTDLERIQGVWSLVHSQNGRSISGEKQVYFMVDGKRACFQTSSGNVEGGLYLDAAGKNKTFDFATSNWTREGIYILEGDVLMMCYDLKSEAQRPSDFTIALDSQRVVFVFKRMETSSSWRRQDGSRAFPPLLEPSRPAVRQPAPTILSTPPL